MAYIRLQQCTPYDAFNHTWPVHWKMYSRVSHTVLVEEVLFVIAAFVVVAMLRSDRQYILMVDF